MWSVLADWTLEPTVIAGLVIAALLYGRGVIYSRQHGQTTRLHWWHVLAFYGGLLVIFIALESALDDYAEQLLWSHMIQHELLMMVAPPLLLLGMPTLPIWRAVPLDRTRAFAPVADARRSTRRHDTHDRPLSSARQLPAWASSSSSSISGICPRSTTPHWAMTTIHAFQHLCFIWAGTILLVTGDSLASRQAPPQLSATGGLSRPGRAGQQFPRYRLHVLDRSDLSLLRCAAARAGRNHRSGRPAHRWRAHERLWNGDHHRHGDGDAWAVAPGNGASQRYAHPSAPSARLTASRINMTTPTRQRLGFR